MSLDQADPFVKSADNQADAFLGGKLMLHQPKTGFRAGSDSVILGASVASSSTHILDLGSGVGAASLCALVRIGKATALLAENQADYAKLAIKNIASNGLETRAIVANTDVTAPGKSREAAGITTDTFTSVIANPPYFQNEKGSRSPVDARADARSMAKQGLDKWVQTAAAAAAPGGEIIFIYRASGLAELLQAFSRFGNLRVLPIAARPEEPAGRILVRGIKGSRAPLQILPPLIMHDANGDAYTQRVEGMLRRGEALHW